LREKHSKGSHVCSCSMLPPTKQESKTCKKGFCKAILTKEAFFSQERLTGIGQETLTKQIKDLNSSLFAIKTWISTILSLSSLALLESSWK